MTSDRVDKAQVEDAPESRSKTATPQLDRTVTLDPARWEAWRNAAGPHIDPEHKSKDWHGKSLGALWDHLNRPGKTPQTTIEAVIHSVRERDVAALNEPANIERLLECDDDSRIEIDERIARLIAVESLTRRRTPSEKPRVWLRNIAARLRRAA